MDKRSAIRWKTPVEARIASSFSGEAFETIINTESKTVLKTESKVISCRIQDTMIINTESKTVIKTRSKVIVVGYKPLPPPLLLPLPWGTPGQSGSISQTCPSPLSPSS